MILTTSLPMFLPPKTTRGIFPVYSLSCLFASWIVALTLTDPLPPSCPLVQNLITKKLITAAVWWNFHDLPDSLEVFGCGNSTKWPFSCQIPHFSCSQCLSCSEGLILGVVFNRHIEFYRKILSVLLTLYTLKLSRIHV